MKQVYLYYGEEDFLIDEEIKRLKANLIQPSTETMNFEKIDGSDEEVISKIINFVNTPSMLSGESLLVVENPGFLKGEKTAEEDMRELEGCIREMPKGVTLIFSYWGIIDRRKKIYKLINQVGEIREFKPFAEWEQEKLLSWIVSKVKLQKKSIGSHAARLLMETSGRNLRALSGEIEKLVTYIGEKAWIEEQDVRALASTGSIEVFALLSALRGKDLQGALHSVNKLLKNKEEPVRLLSLLATQYRMLLQVKSLEAEGRNFYEIAEILSANPYFVRKCGEGTKNFSIPELIRDLEFLYNVDLKLKRGNPPGLTLELLITELCGA